MCGCSLVAAFMLAAVISSIVLYFTDAIPMLRGHQQSVCPIVTAKHAEEVRVDVEKALY